MYFYSHLQKMGLEFHFKKNHQTTHFVLYKKHQYDEFGDKIEHIC